MGRIEVRGDTSRETQIDGYATTAPPSESEGGRERSEQGDARNSPQHPPRHSRKPTSFPRTREPREKQSTPFPPKQPTRPSPQPPYRNNVSPPPSLREGGRERSEQGDARNSPQYPRHVIPADAGTQRKTKHAIPNTPPQKPNHQPVSQFVPQFKTKPCTSTYMVLPNCTSHFYLTGTALLY